MPNSVVRDSRGRIFVTYPDRRMPQVFDASGKFVGDLTREGRGPGEVTRPTHVRVGRGDTLYVFERTGVLVLSPAFGHVRRVGIPGGASDAAVLATGEVVINALLPTRQFAGGNLHAFRPDGTHEASFGPPPDSLAATPFHAIAPGRHEGVWSVPAGTYRITRFDVNGRTIQELTRTAEWFVQREPEEPRALVIAIREDSDGRLWVASRVKRDDWRRHKPAGVADGEGRLSSAGLHELFDTMLEIVDPAAGRLIVAQRVPGLLVGLFEHGHLALYSEDSEGTPRLAVIRAHPDPALP
jgi:hypothetical protein